MMADGKFCKRGTGSGIIVLSSPYASWEIITGQKKYGGDLRRQKTLEPIVVDDLFNDDVN